MEPMSTRDLEVVYDRLISNFLVTPGLAEHDLGRNANGRTHLDNAHHPQPAERRDAPRRYGLYLHPEGRAHALMFPLVYLLQQFLTPEGTSEA
eukprot:2062918-Amphidinium_carterae.1